MHRPFQVPKGFLGDQRRAVMSSSSAQLQHSAKELGKSPKPGRGPATGRLLEHMGFGRKTNFGCYFETRSPTTKPLLLRGSRLWIPAHSMLRPAPTLLSVL